MNKRLGELDVLRAAAVLLVLGRHLQPLPQDLAAPMQVLLGSWQKCGWMGVDLFFVLSGFLVSGLIFREYQRFRRVRVGSFLLRRGLKIYPAFYVFLAATVCIEYMLGRLTWKWPVFCEAAFIQNYGPALWNHTWSLAVEEHFYIFLPLLLGVSIWLRKDASEPFGHLVWFFASMAVALVALRIAMSMTVVYANKSHMYPTHLRIDSLMFGVLLSYLLHFHRGSTARFVQRHLWLLVPLALILVSTSLAFEVDDPFMHTIGFSLIYVGCGILLIVLLLWESNTKGRVMEWCSGIAGIGVYSYSIYLWHMPVQRWGIPVARHLYGSELGFYMESLIYLLGSIAAGVAMAKIVEMPVLRIRDRWFPSRSGVLPSLDHGNDGMGTPETGVQSPGTVA